MSKTKLKNVDFPRDEGGNLIIPASFKNHDEAILWLQRKRDEAEQEVAFVHEFKAFPLDAAVAFSRALDNLFGFVCADATTSFFGKKPPLFINVPIGPNPEDNIRVPVGQMSIPNIEGTVTSHIVLQGEPHFALSAKVKKKNEAQIKEIIEEVENQLATNSIYKGKAVSLDLSWVHGGTDLFGNAKYNPQLHAPQFLRLPSNPEVVLNPAAQAALELELWGHIRNRVIARKLGLDPKRGVLLYGAYGTGKSHVGLCTAKMCVENSTTFITLRNVQDLAMCLRIAVQYAPVVVFAEDIDQAVGNSRDEAVNDILNTLDGVELKGKEIITVLTTNHVDDISAAMKRPGRTIPIHIDLPDENSVVRLIQLYGRGDIDATSDFTEAAKLMAGKFPPTQVKAVVEAARMAAVNRLGTGDIAGKILGEDVYKTALVAQDRLKHCSVPEPDKRPAVVQFAEALGDYLVTAVTNSAKWGYGPFGGNEYDGNEMKPHIQGTMDVKNLPPVPAGIVG